MRLFDLHFAWIFLGTPHGWEDFLFLPFLGEDPPLLGEDFPNELQNTPDCIELASPQYMNKNATSFFLCSELDNKKRGRRESPYLGKSPYSGKKFAIKYACTSRAPGTPCSTA